MREVQAGRELSKTPDFLIGSPLHHSNKVFDTSRYCEREKEKERSSEKKQPVVPVPVTVAWASSKCSGRDMMRKTTVRHR